MKILFLNPDLPFPLTSGSNVRCFSLMAQLSNYLSLTAVTFARGHEHVQADQIAQLCSAYYQFQVRSKKWYWRGRRFYAAFDSRRHRTAIRRLVETEQFDLIHCGHPAVFPLVSQYTEIPVILQQDNLHLQTQLELSHGVSPGKRGRTSQQKALLRFLAGAWSRATAVITVSEEDRQKVLHAAPQANVHVIRFGIDAMHFKPGLYATSLKTIVLPGAMDRPANIEAADFFVERIWPGIHRADPEVRLFIVGRKPAAKLVELNRLRNVVVTGEVVDMRPFLGGATVVVFPQCYSGSSGVKILEAMAMARPVVAFTTASEGLQVQSNHNVLLASDAAEFEAQVLAVLQDSNLQQKLGRNAREYVLRRHTWEQVGLDLFNLYHNLLQRDVQCVDIDPPVLHPEHRKSAPHQSRIEQIS